MSDEPRQHVTKCDALTPTQRVFAMHRARGKSVSDAAKGAGVSRTTPATHWDMDLVNGAILEIQQRMIDSPIDAIGHLIPKAIAVVEKALDGDDLAAAKEVFDRSWGKPTQRQEIAGDPEKPFVVKVIGGGARMEDL